MEKAVISHIYKRSDNKMAMIDENGLLPTDFD